MKRFELKQILFLIKDAKYDYGSSIMEINESTSWYIYPNH